MELSEQGCLLRREESGEHFLLLVFFLRESGLVQLLTRKRQTSTGLLIPDLYDRGRVTWERKGSNKPPMLKDFEPDIHHGGIARNYSALNAAARLSRFYERNLLHMETFDEAWDILSRALGAISTGNYPEVALLKALFLVARSEGYSVSSGWLQKLPAEIRQSVRSTLLCPLEEVTTETAQVEIWIRWLLQFFQHETDLLPPD